MSDVVLVVTPGWWTYRGGASSGTVRAFGSGKVPGRWIYIDTARQHALFGLYGPDSMTSGSDVAEAQDYGPPDDNYPMVAQSGLFIENDSPKEAWSPSRKLEDA